MIGPSRQRFVNHIPQKARRPLWKAKILTAEDAVKLKTYIVVGRLVYFLIHLR